MARKDTQCGVLKSGYAESSCYRVHFGSDGQLKLLDEVRSPWLSWARTLVRHHILIVAAIFARRVYVGVYSAADRGRRVPSACRRGRLPSAGGRCDHRPDSHCPAGSRPAGRECSLSRHGGLKVLAGERSRRYEWSCYYPVKLLRRGQIEPPNAGEIESADWPPVCPAIYRAFTS